MNESEDYVTTERVLLVALHLIDHGRITTTEAASLAGITYEGARQMLEKFSRVAPVGRDDEAGLWLWLRE